MYKFINDRYRKARGGSSRVLDVKCEHCDQHITYYQKDGPGQLKRMYVDRFIDQSPTHKVLACPQCNTELGILFNYKKEKRPAYKLFVGTITKKIVSKDSLS